VHPIQNEVTKEHIPPEGVVPVVPAVPVVVVLPPIFAVTVKKKRIRNAETFVSNRKFR
jgi:hypothetical protein